MGINKRALKTSCYYVVQVISRTSDQTPTSQLEQIETTQSEWAQFFQQIVRTSNANRNIVIV